MNPHRSAAPALALARTRLAFGVLAFVASLVVLSIKLVELGILAEERTPSAARTAASEHPVERGDILDRNGQLLAASVVSRALVAWPPEIDDVEAVAARLSVALPWLSFEEARQRLSLRRKFVFVARRLTPRDQKAVLDLGLPGIGLRSEDMRIYPHGRLVAHVLGRTRPSDGGLVGNAGAEKRFNEILSDPTQSVQLSIDIRIQHIIREELARAVARFSAIGGAGLALDIRTGEVLAMVSLPDFDPNRQAKTDEARANRASLLVAEMGSTFKLLTLATALDRGISRLTSRFDATAPIKAFGRRIGDYRGQNRVLSAAEVVVHSSNIGAARMAEKIGAGTFKEYLDGLGLLSRPALELPEVGHPIVPRTWHPLTTMTVGFGHGLSVSPLQTASAIGALANDGVAVPVTLLRRTMPPTARRVFSSETSDKMRWMMRQAVLRGSGSRADNASYPVGGKTGTAEKVVNGRYDSSKRLSSFVGVFPIADPRFAVIVMLDEPKAVEGTYGFATAAWNAVPVAGSVIPRIGSILGVPAAGPDSDAWMQRVVPDRLLSRLFLDEEA